jgi:glucoamylase
VAWLRAALTLVAAGAVAVAVVSGGSSADPRTPAGLPGLPPPFLGTAVAGNGGLTAAIDAYGDVVDLRGPGPAGRALIDNPADRQAAGTVAADTGIVPLVSVDGGAARPLWRADSVTQRYLLETNVVRTVARFGRVRVVVTDAAAGEKLVRVAEVSAPTSARARPSFGVHLDEADCDRRRTAGKAVLVCRSGAGRRGGGRTAPPLAAGASRFLATAARGDRRWISRAKRLGPDAPAWARRMYRRSLLALRALTDRRTGAVAAGARDGWAYVWPRDAGTVAIALAASGYPAEARRIARFLLGLDLRAAARFHGDGAPVAGREAQGDAAGWVAAAARAADLPAATESLPWRNRPDYREGEPGDYLANAIAGSFAADGHEARLYGGKSARRREAGRGAGAFGTADGLVRQAGDPASGLDSAAAWAVRPFPMPGLFRVAGRTLLRLAAEQTRFGVTPGEGWSGADPWTSPTAWTAWSLAALSGRERRGGSQPARRRYRRAALRLLSALRRAATPAGSLPERIDAHTGLPRSTTPLAWSHAFAILALRQLWP